MTVPFPDTIAIIAEIKNEHLANPSSTGGGAKQIYKGVDKHLQEFIEVTKKETLLVPKPYVVAGEHAKADFWLAYNSVEPLHRAHLTLQRRPGQDYGIWSVRLEFSVSKASSQGLVKLTAAVEEALPIIFEKVLPDFRVSRVDAAIDLIGIRPIDVITRIKKPGKRLVYVGDYGEPESIYLYEKRKPLKEPPKSLATKTTGAFRLKLYERRDYLKQLLLAPPYGNCPVTRVETTKKWTNKKPSDRPSLSSLAKLSSPFSGTHVAYAAKLAASQKKPQDWLAFCLAAFGGGASTAQRKWPGGIGLNFRKTYSTCPGDLVQPDCWERWQNGLKYTGLDDWIVLAGAKG